MTILYVDHSYMFISCLIVASSQPFNFIMQNDQSCHVYVTCIFFKKKPTFYYESLYSHHFVFLKTLFNKINMHIMFKIKKMIFFCKKDKLKRKTLQLE